MFQQNSGTFEGAPPLVLDMGHMPEYVRGIRHTPVGPVPKVTSRLLWSDRMGGWKSRWDIGRMDFRVDPGLYALGCPDSDSPVLVSANYKLSFDRLRSALPGLSCWILVLDTDGVNVWCAAGKGTLGTAELVRQVQACRLAELVHHRRLIVPQLGAPGVSAHAVKRSCGFSVDFGPVRAEDLPAYLLAGGAATEEMRQVRFGFWERAVVIPVELVHALRTAVRLALVLWLLAGVGWAGTWVHDQMEHGLRALMFLTLAVLAGAVVTPLGLPGLPGRAFFVKGLWAFLVSAFATAWWWWPDQWTLSVALELLGLGGFGLAGASYLAMNFTGASTYTSLSGVRREMALGVPVIIGLLALGLSLWLSARFFV